MSTFYPTAETLSENARTLPQAYYTSPAIFQEELDRIFCDRWLCVGREEQVSDPGDYFLQDVGNENLIVVRDRAGVVRAHYNVCRHRGTRVCTESKGRFSRSIQCPYHAWTYGLDGRLIGAPHMQDVPGFQAEDYPLHAAAVAAWEGLIFINLKDDPEPFEDAFAPLLGKFASWRLPELRIVREIEYDVHANWKLIFENYSECYHCPTIHPALKTIYDYTGSRNDLIEGPFLGGFIETSREDGSFTTNGRRCALPIHGMPDDEMRRIYYYTLFPNLFLSLHPDYAAVHILRPLAEDRTRIVCQWLFHPEAMADDAYRPEEAIEFWDRVNRQDWDISERTQAGVVSKVYTPGPYSDRESLLAAFDREALRALGHAEGL